MPTLPHEIVNRIFQYLTLDEAKQIMSVCKSFRWEGLVKLNDLLIQNNITLTEPVYSFFQVKQALTVPLRKRLTDLYTYVSDLKHFLNGEEWQISPTRLNRFQGDPSTGTATFSTDYLPLTLAHEPPHLTTSTPDYLHDLSGGRMDLGYYLRSGKFDYREVVNARELLQAYLDLIDWMHSQRDKFLTLPDGTVI